MPTDVSNAEFQLAVQYVNQTARPIFLTGKAGQTVLRNFNLTIPAAHASVNLAALKAGKHAYCEKPMGVDVPQTRNTGNTHAIGR